MPSINCEIELDLPWSKECVISDISIAPRVAGDPNANPPASNLAGIQTIREKFQINNSTLYVPVVTLSINNYQILENIKQGFKRTILWNKYRSDITAQLKKQ